MSQITQKIRSSLQWRLMLSYLAVIVITVGGVSSLAGILTTRQFRSLVAQSGQIRAQGLALYFGDYYQTQGSWHNVQEAMDQLDLSRWRPIALRLEDAPMFPWRIVVPSFIRKETIERWVNLGQPQTEQIILVGLDGSILAENTTPRTVRHIPIDRGMQLPPAIARRGAPVIVQGQQVGTVLTASALGYLTPQQRAFVSVIWRRLLGISLLAGFVALALSHVLAQRILKPVQALTAAARGIAAGNWDQKLPVKSEDELGQMTVAFNDMADELSRQTSLRRQMVADIAHELRTPLSVLQIELEALEDGLQSPQEATASLREELGLLTKLVDDLRTLARTDAGEFTLDTKPSDLAQLVRDTVERWQGRAAARNVHLTCEIASPLPPVSMDDTRISQVLTNLLANALRHTPRHGEIHVNVDQCYGRISGTQEPRFVLRSPLTNADKGEDQPFIRVAIRDTGEGIPKADLPFIFERFYRVDRARQRDTGGAGLGLAIAHQVVALHGGHIWAESEEGAGSTFTFVLPV